MHFEVFTCDEMGCGERLERFRGLELPSGWQLVPVGTMRPGAATPDLDACKPVVLCPTHALELARRFAHVPLPRGGQVLDGLVAGRARA